MKSTRLRPPHTVNVVNVRPDGPNVMTGDLVVLAHGKVREMKTAILCRCGLSKDKPFCDGAHVKGGFRDPGVFRISTRSEAPSEGRVTVTPIPNGPLRCDGPLVVRDAVEHASATHPTSLCRCGGSHNKPFCDGTHRRIGFAG